MFKKMCRKDLLKSQKRVRKGLKMLNWLENIWETFVMTYKGLLWFLIIFNNL